MDEDRYPSWPDETLFHRPPYEAVTGKCDTRMDIPMPEQMRDELSALAVLHHMSAATYARLILSRHIYGELAIVRNSVAAGGGHGDGRTVG